VADSATALILDNGCALGLFLLCHDNFMDKENILPPVKIAILIDGGFFV